MTIRKTHCKKNQSVGHDSYSQTEQFFNMSYLGLESMGKMQVDGDDWNIFII